MKVRLFVLLSHCMVRICAAAQRYREAKQSDTGRRYDRPRCHFAVHFSPEGCQTDYGRRLQSFNPDFLTDELIGELQEHLNA